MTIAGLDAEVLYAGGAPGLVAGALQINVKVPAEAPSGEQTIVVKVGETESPQGVTVSIQ